MNTADEVPNGKACEKRALSSEIKSIGMFKKLSAGGEKPTGYRADSAKIFFFWVMPHSHKLLNCVYLNFSYEGRLCSCQLFYEDNSERIKDAFIWVTPVSVRGDLKIDTR